MERFSTNTTFVELTSSTKSNILIIAFETKNMHLVDYLLQHTEYGLPEILRAVKLLDSKRKIRYSPSPAFPVYIF